MSEFPCDKCDRIYKYKRSLRDHVKAEHLNKTTYSCPKCEKKYKEKRLLNQHLKVAHDLKEVQVKVEVDDDENRLEF